MSLAGFAATGAANFAVSATAGLPGALFTCFTAVLAGAFAGAVAFVTVDFTTDFVAAGLEAGALVAALPEVALPEVAPRAAEVFADDPRGVEEATFAVDAFALVAVLALLVFAAVLADFAAERAGALTFADLELEDLALEDLTLEDRALGAVFDAVFPAAPALAPAAPFARLGADLEAAVFAVALLASGLLPLALVLLDERVAEAAVVRDRAG